MILVIRLSKEQNFAIISRYPMEVIRRGVEQGIQDMSDKFIEEDRENKKGGEKKTDRGPCLTINKASF